MSIVAGQRHTKVLTTPRPNWPAMPPRRSKESTIRYKQQLKESTTFSIVLHRIAIIQHRPQRLRLHVIQRNTTRRNATQFAFNVALRFISIREFKKTTTAMATAGSLNKRFNEQNNGCARVL